MTEDTGHRVLEPAHDNRPDQQRAELNWNGDGERYEPFNNPSQRGDQSSSLRHLTA